MDASTPKPPATQTTIRAEIGGESRCTALDLTVCSTSPVLAMCRTLVEAGHDPAAPLEAWRGVPARSAPPTVSPATPLTGSTTLLVQAIARVRPDLDPARPVKQRVRAFWAGVVAARGTPEAQVREQFIELALDTGLCADFARRPPYAAEATVEHLIRWGLLGRDPFGRV